MSKDSGKKLRKHLKTELEKSYINAVAKAPFIREAWIAAIEAGAAAAIAVIQKATIEELVNSIPLDPVSKKMPKKNGKSPEPSTKISSEAAPAG
jgi:hypothetical protein